LATTFLLLQAPAVDGLCTEAPVAITTYSERRNLVLFQEAGSSNPSIIANASPRSVPVRTVPVCPRS
jgi:hypothetical protein